VRERIGPALASPDFVLEAQYRAIDNYTAVRLRFACERFSNCDRVGSLAGKRRPLIFGPPPPSPA
jgi:hypothetical protein